MTGDALVKSLKPDEKANVVTFPGPAGSGWAESFNDGFKSAATKSPAVKILGEKFGDSGVAVQLQLIQDALQAYPNMNVIWGTAPTAEAAIGAVAEAGRSDIKIISSYENQAMLDALKRGDIMAFATQYPVAEGAISIDQAVRLIEKKPVMTFVQPLPDVVVKGDEDKITHGPCAGAGNLDAGLFGEAIGPMPAVEVGYSMSDSTAAGARNPVASEPLLRLRGITKRFTGVLALDGVDFDLRPGELHVLFGENGAGKSTLINVIAGIFAPDSGEFRYNGQDIHNLTPHRARAIGISPVFQEFSLVPSLTVEDNLFLGREMSAGGVLNAGRMRRAARKLIDELGFSLEPASASTTCRAPTSR